MIALFVIMGILGVFTGLVPITIRLIVAQSQRNFEAKYAVQRVIPETHYAWED